MAPLAALAKASAMLVIAAMTGVAGRGHAHFLAHRFAVACIAMESLVPAAEYEFGLGVVIETPERPSVRIVARSTFRPEAALVRVAFFVAVCAFESRPLVGGGEVAFLARHDGVQPDQREPRQIVIEEDFFGPAAGIMAAFALRAEATFVYVVALVAGVAGRAGF